MFIGTRFLLPALCCLLAGQISAQSVAITFQNPADLYVCGQDAFGITVKNNTATALSGLQLTLSLPVGIEYLPGSIGGATEFNVANASAPVFTLSDLAAGATAVLSGQEKALCSALAAINSGQTFSNTAQLSYVGGSQQATSLAYPVETGLLTIVSLSPATQSGQNGQVLSRTITVLNTRQGPVSSLHFTDQHLPGLSMQLAGATGTNTGVFFESTVPGSYFTAFGDGDALLEYNETITLTEQITIENCGIPSFSNPSTIHIGWGCGNNDCQQDVTTAEVTILPSAQNPMLVFQPLYTPQVSQCAGEPATQELLIINTGVVQAQNVTVTLLSNDTARLGMDFNSVLYESGSGWLPLTPTSGKPQTLSACSANFYSNLTLSVPLVPAGDTVRLRFDTYFCQPVCEEGEVGVSGLFYYQNNCPAASTQSGNFLFKPDTAATTIRSKIYFDIGDCIADQSAHTFTYWVKSQRLLNTSGYVQLEMELPWGLFWQNDCAPTLDGKSPVLVQVDTVPNVSTTLHLAFQLPMSQDSVYGEFCLLNICQDVSAYPPAIPNPPPSGASYTVYPVQPPCSPCVQKINALTFITTALDVSAPCGISVCDKYELVLDCGCGDHSCIGSPGAGSIIIADYDAWRINVGLRDDDDDRHADDGSPADPGLIRRDRFLPGDTMRTQLRGAVVQGNVAALGFRIFNECWQSDFGLDDGDSFEIRDGQFPFTNGEDLHYLGGSVVLKIAATGATYECPVNFAAVQVDRNYLRIAVPNVRPEQIYDELITMFHQFNISLPDLADAGCLPAGLKLQPGDSLLFRGDFVFRQNFTPIASSAPPLINFRNAICGTDHIFAWKLQGCFPPLLRQYSGYIERIRPPVYTILPCTTSHETFPFRYTLRIARGNMFPYELRPLAVLSNYSHTLPGVDLLETRLKFLRLQENTVLFSDQLLPVTSSNNTMLLDLDPFFHEALDEGFALEIGSVFAPSCGFVGPLNTLTKLQIRYPNAGFHTPVVAQTELTNLTGYTSAAPQLALIPEDSVIEIATEQLELDFLLRNLTPAVSPNSWLSVSATGSGLSNMEIVVLPSGQTLPLIGGLYQLGAIPGFGQPQFQLRGMLDACAPITVTLTYGWDCDPVTNLAGQPCRTYTKTIQLIPQSPELELVIVDQPTTLSLCTPSDFFVFEIYNAAKGRAYSPVGSIKLPAGMTVLAGSSQISSPTGAAWAALPNPVQLAGNVYEWSPALPNGLFPFAQAPQNSLSIRFRAVATCGFVANSQPIYGADCRKPCGLSSNKLRKPGLPIQLEGLEPDYSVEAQLTLVDPNGSAGCGETTGLSAILNLGGAPMPGDSVFVLLPAGVSYVAGSYQPGPNAPAGPPEITASGFRLALPAGLSAGSELRFVFSVRYDVAGCSDQAVLLQTREQSQAFCAQTNTNCSVYVATGEAILFLQVDHPELGIKNFVATAAGTGIAYNAVLENAGAGTAINPVVQFFLDQNHNGQKDANEPIVGQQQTNGSLLPATLLAIAGALPLTAADLCDLAALLPATANCACTDRVLPLGGQATIVQTVGLCGLATVPLQVDSLAGHTYTWLTPSGLACATCAQTSYTPPAGVQSGDLVTLVLEEKMPGCILQHRFDLQFGGSLGVETEDQIICQGESVQLEATPGGAYAWTGPGIINPALAIQVLQPAQSGNYAVTVTFAGGCTGTGQVAVTVLPRDSVDLGVITTCIGQPVPIFGVLTETPGLYHQILPKANGCDSVLSLRLLLTPTETSELHPLCAGDSTLVFDSLFHTAGSVCRTFISSTGCDSTHCVTVTAVPNPVIPVQDSVIIGLGQEIVLDGPDGYAAYFWEPATGLSCYDCADPLAQPDTTTNYLLVVADDHGCMGSVQYRVLVFPPCDPHRLLIPNAFTPNGDGINDAFRIVPYEGLESVLELTIYDRWGEKVYAGSGAAASWDGMIRGKPAPSDVYVYQLVVNCNGEKTPLTMELTLLR